MTDEILKRAMEVLDLIDIDIREAEREVARLVLEICDALEKGEMTFDEADRIFTALLALKTVELGEEIEEMLTLANELHDGKLEVIVVIRGLAREFLGSSI